MADYPGTVTSFTDQINKGSPVIDEYHLDAADVNDIYGEVVAIETELGTNPAGGEATVAARLSAIELVLVPSGIIAMWHGTNANIPNNWALCDGTSGTPDLRDKFVKGTSVGVDPGGTGGSPTKTIAITNLPAHNHTASSNSTGGHTHTEGGTGGHDHGGSVTGGSHGHTIRVYAMYLSGGPNGPFYAVRSNDPYTNSTDAIQDTSHSHNLNIATVASHTHTINSVGSHSHTVTVNNTGSGTAINIEPAYYKLAFIMKT